MTPSVVDVAAHLAGQPGRVVLDSGANDDGLGCSSLVAALPEVTVEAWGNDVIVRDSGGRELRRSLSDPLRALELEWSRFCACSTFATPRPVAVGYIGYEVGALVLPKLAYRGPGVVPDMWFGFYPAMWVWDGPGDRPRLVARDAAAGRRLDSLLAGTARGESAVALGPLSGSEESCERYRAGVEQVLDYIRAGDVYQVNLSRQLSCQVSDGVDSLDIYCRIGRLSPAAFGAVLDVGHGSVISASPEQFLRFRARDRYLETRPIKGTRARVGDADLDATITRELSSDAKERAEHLMIVDLERNDLGKIAEIGSVVVDSFARVVELPTVHHMVSTVSCTVRQCFTLADVLGAMFPGGSITGAPKIRSMQVIDELEGERRGPYTGAIGHIDSDGGMHLSIAIRTAVLARKQLSLRVGGGIVADSTVDREFVETVEKAAAWQRAFAGAAAA